MKLETILEQANKSPSDFDVFVDKIYQQYFGGKWQTYMVGGGFDKPSLEKIREVFDSADNQLTEQKYGVAKFGRKSLNDPNQGSFDFEQKLEPKESAAKRNVTKKAKPKKEKKKETVELSGLCFIWPTGAYGSERVFDRDVMGENIVKQFSDLGVSIATPKDEIISCLTVPEGAKECAINSYDLTKPLTVLIQTHQTVFIDELRDPSKLHIKCEAKRARVYLYDCILPNFYLHVTMESGEFIIETNIRTRREIKKIEVPNKYFTPCKNVRIVYELDDLYDNESTPTIHLIQPNSKDVKFVDPRGTLGFSAKNLIIHDEWTQKCTTKVQLKRENTAQWNKLNLPGSVKTIPIK